MPTLMPSDTRTALGLNGEKCDSRSLLLDRFVYDNPNMNEARKLHFAQVCADSFATIESTREAWKQTLNDAKANPRTKDEARKFREDTNGLGSRASVVGASGSAKVTAHQSAFAEIAGGHLLFAQLQSRLLVNMAGGVMENAGLCLDRFGLPYLPGSAVKGCARRAATHALVETTSAEDKAELLFNLCLVFGWADADWHVGRKRNRRNGRDVETEPYSDFWWAMAPDTGDRSADDANRNQTWSRVAITVANRLLDHLRVHKRAYPNEPWRDRPSFAGSISFLPAYPVDLGRTGQVDGLPHEVPTLGKLELDVVTCHHRDYYEGRLNTATDTEEPNPVVFPAVASGHIYTFALIPLRSADAGLLKLARTWLNAGLETFGLGAKTNAGYGWFDASDAVQGAVRNALEDAARREREAREREKAERKRKDQEAERLRQKQERDAALTGLSGDARADKEIELLTDQQFDAKVRAFCKDTKRGGPTDEQKKAIVRALRGPRHAYWQNFKTKATKGDLATVDQAIRQLSKQMFPGKEGMMP